MSAARPTLRRPAALRAAVVGLLSVVALVLGGTTASAHDTVIGTAPGDGETLTTAPTQVSVEISADPQTLGSRMVITASGGTVLFDGEPTITDRVASVELPAVANDGYQVAWRLVSSDGHPIEGTFGFVVDAPASVAPTEDATTEAPATTDVAETTEAADPTTEASATTESATPTADSDGDSSGTSWVPVALIVVVIGGLVLLVLFRRRSALQDQS